MSMARFSNLPEDRGFLLLQDMDSEQTSGSTPDPGYVDDVYPGFERDSEPESSPCGTTVSMSGGASPGRMPMSGGACPSRLLMSGGNSPRYSANEGAKISADSSHSSSPAPSIRAVGRVKVDASEVEASAQKKLGQRQLDRADVLEMVLKLWETQVEVQGARPFQASLGT